MNLTLIEHSYEIAATEFNCEACEMFWSMEEKRDYRGIVLSDIMLFYRAKTGKVKEGERYLLFVFANEWGERLEFKAMLTMHRFMFRMGFYPEYFLTPMIEYRRIKRIEKADKLIQYARGKESV